MWNTRPRCILAGLLSCLSFARVTFGFQQDAKSTDPQVAASSIAGSVNAVTGDGQMTTLLPNSYDNCESSAFDIADEGPTPEEVFAENELREAVGQATLQFRESLRSVVLSSGAFGDMPCAERCGAGRLRAHRRPSFVSFLRRQERSGDSSAVHQKAEIY